MYKRQVQGGPEPVRAAVARARRFDVPLAAVWSQDWLGRRKFGAGNVGVRYRWSVDESWYPDLAGLIRELNAGGVRFLGYFNPFLVPEQDLYADAVRDNFIARAPGGAPATFPISVVTGGVLDVSNPAAPHLLGQYSITAYDLSVANGVVYIATGDSYNQFVSCLLYTSDAADE